jgi:hypothetical protein
MSASKEPAVKRFTIEVLQEKDGRWLADIPSVPGAMAYAKTEWEAIWKALEIRDDVPESRTEIEAVGKAWEIKREGQTYTRELVEKIKEDADD